MFMGVALYVIAQIFKRGIEIQTENELSEKAGLTLSNLSILKTGKAKAIRLLTFD